VIPVEEVEAVDLERFGPLLELHPAFPARTNVHIVQALSPDHLVMRVWERGAGPTLACGTGACATLVACHSLGLCERRARLDLPGGSLEIHWSPDDGHVFMAGPAEAVFDGVVTPRLLGLEESASADPAPEAQPPQAPQAPRQQVADIDCASVCVRGCIRPEACANADARARVEALLAGTSLDDLVAMASESANRGRARFPSESGPTG
jgi:diaminopimelate epimerase